nr:MAG TPA: hypothetical protein [Caudoviricetes sp.]
MRAGVDGYGQDVGALVVAGLDREDRDGDAAEQVAGVAEDLDAGVGTVTEVGLDEQAGDMLAVNGEALLTHDMECVRVDDEVADPKLVGGLENGLHVGSSRLLGRPQYSPIDRSGAIDCE